MADENTQATPQGGQEQATQPSLYVYYYSDPDESDKLLHHLPIPSYIDLSDYIAQGKLWKVYNIGAPDKSMVDPVVDIKSGAPHWVENDKNAQTQILAQEQEKLAELDKGKAELDQSIKAVKDTQQSADKQFAMLTQQTTALNKAVMTSQKQNAKTLISMQKTLTLLVQNLGKSSTDAGKADQAKGGNN